MDTAQAVLHLAEELEVIKAAKPAPSATPSIAPAQLEEMHTGQITELEERIDFTERLLTERREQIGPG